MRTRIVPGLLALLLIPSLVVLPPARAEEIAPTGRSIRLPLEVGKNPSGVLDMASLHVLLGRNYSEAPQRSPGSKMFRKSGIVASKNFSLRNEVDGWYRTIELGVAGFPETGWELFLYGVEIKGGVETSNPDLPTIETALKQFVAALPKADGTVTMPVPEVSRAYTVYNLSYTQSDRAISALKALGFSTIEFQDYRIDGAREKIYTLQATSQQKFPWIVKLLDPPKTSLMDPPPIEASTESGVENANLGGTFLHDSTSGEQPQRLLVVYDAAHPEQATEVLNLLREKLDRPARQILIEALVLEMNTDKARDLGIAFGGQKGHVSGSALEVGVGGSISPFTLTWDRNANLDVSFKATLSAMIEKGTAEVLSKPSVLVLDGRQARIQVGQQVPVSSSTATATTVSESVSYLTVGIVLNLRPRVNEEGSEITMQVETIVSAIDLANTPISSNKDEIRFAPTLGNRQVQSFVRVANETPFIIGGLISTTKQERTTGIPLLSSIPFFGSLFRRSQVQSDKKEVIVVLTPHVLPLEDENFSYVIPKDSETFDSFGYQLFRNAYRVRSGDVYDLGFLENGEALKRLRADTNRALIRYPELASNPDIAQIAAGGIPGEEILVRRMLWELVRAKRFSRFVDLGKTIFFEDAPGEGDAGFQLSFLGPRLGARSGNDRVLALRFDRTDSGSADHPFPRPKARVSEEKIRPADFWNRLRQANLPGKDGVAKERVMYLGDAGEGPLTPSELLRQVLVLKRLLDVNEALPLTVRDYHVGRQVIFPSETDLEQRFHLVDRETADLFWEVWDYYTAFEQEFNRKVRSVNQAIEAAAQSGATATKKGK